MIKVAIWEPIFTDLGPMLLFNLYCRAREQGISARVETARPSLDFDLWREKFAKDDVADANFTFSYHAGAEPRGAPYWIAVIEESFQLTPVLDFADGSRGVGYILSMAGLEVKLPRYLSGSCSVVVVPFSHAVREARYDVVYVGADRVLGPTPGGNAFRLAIDRILDSIAWHESLRTAVIEAVDDSTSQLSESKRAPTPEMPAPRAETLTSIGASSASDREPPPAPAEEPSILDEDPEARALRGLVELVVTGATDIAEARALGRRSIGRWLEDLADAGKSLRTGLSTPAELTAELKTAMADRPRPPGITPLQAQAFTRWPARHRMSTLVKIAAGVDRLDLIELHDGSAGQGAAPRLHVVDMDPMQTNLEVEDVA